MPAYRLIYLVRHIVSLLAICGMPAVAFAEGALDTVLNARAQTEIASGVSEVRAEALRQIGRSLGMRAGLADGSAAILSEIERDKNILDTKFNFGAVTFPTGALPPVIEEAKDVISVMDYSMRVAGTVYLVKAPARFQQANWRDYLYLGLAVDKDPLVGESQRSAYPRDDNEAAYWKKVVKEGYTQGRRQAKEIFDLNMNRLVRDYKGMWLYYELASRGLVSPPEIATATESVNRPDPNTLVIGETVIRITAQPKFEANGTKWKTKQ